jgi:hypothetical protein
MAPYFSHSFFQSQTVQHHQDRKHHQRHGQCRRRDDEGGRYDGSIHATRIARGSYGGQHAASGTFSKGCDLERRAVVEVPLVPEKMFTA